MGAIPTTMKAWTKTRSEVGGFSLEEHPVPQPGPGEVLVKTQSTSVCGTDIHIWKWDDWSRENVPLGTVTGHETSGSIVALGEGVSSHAVGDVVAIECHLLAGRALVATKATPMFVKMAQFLVSTGTELLPRFLPYPPSTLDTSQRVLTRDTLPFRIPWAMPFTP